MTPLLGDAFLTSAIKPGLPVLACAALIAPMKSRLGAAIFNIMESLAMGCFSLIFSISTALYLSAEVSINKIECQTQGKADCALLAAYHTISSSMLRGLFSSVCMTLKSTGPHLSIAGNLTSVTTAKQRKLQNRLDRMHKLTPDCLCLLVPFGVCTPHYPATR